MIHCVIIIFLLGYHIMITNSIWYKSLKKSNLTPPSYIFKYVWIILYIMMFFSLIKYLKTNKKNKIGLIFYIIQLFFNLIWTSIFFKYRNIKKGLFVLISLWISLMITFNIFYRESKEAGLLLIPYLVWTSFALYLNYYIVISN
jgi:tryptophan-rich sensory protein